MSAPARPNAAVLYNPDGYRAARTVVRGRHVAGHGFLKALVEHGEVDAFHGVSEDRGVFESFAEAIAAFDTRSRPAHFIQRRDHAALARIGTLYVPHPRLDVDAWARRFGDERAYSITGVTHTIATPAAVRVLCDYLTTPTQPWDALVCTSVAVRQAVERIIAGQAEFLARRGGAPANPVRMPIIPLGVDSARFAPSESAPADRTSLRTRIGAGDDDVVLLYFGWMSHLDKMHPGPLFRAAARAQASTEVPLRLLMVGGTPGESARAAWRDAARRHAPDLAVTILDGSDGDVARAAWHAADIFVSLPDNIQESFGLTPLEAMAAGLPVVASDWDGYRDTVVDGETGFLVPTRAPAPGSGIELADALAGGTMPFETYAGATSQSVAIDVDACAAAIARLAADRGLRARMGAAGQDRIAATYEWRHVIRSYQELWTELAAVRRAAPGVALREPRRESVRPQFPDPFAVFGGHASDTFSGGLQIAAVPDARAIFEVVRASPLDTGGARWLLGRAHAERLIDKLSQGPIAVDRLLGYYPADVRPQVLRTIGWLAKHAIITPTNAGADGDKPE